MSSSNRNVLFIVGGIAIFIAFWLLILGPKRNEASDLNGKVGELEKSVADQQQRLEFSEQAQTDFPANYQRVVVMGKAVPENSDTASLIVQLDRIAKSSGIQFRNIELGQGGQPAAAAPTQPGIGAAPPASSQPSTTSPTPESGAASGSTPVATDPTQSTLATEAAAAPVAIGASVGPAGLNVLNYKLKFQGNFFEIADFMQGLDRLVTAGDGKVVVNGRLTTVDGFSLNLVPANAPELFASVTVTTYLTPPGQGLTAGATPSGPAASEAPQLTASTGGG